MSTVVCLKLEVYNIASSPRVITMANQVLVFNVTKNVSAHFKNCLEEIKKLV